MLCFSLQNYRAYSFCGTIEYMAPEVVEGGHSGHDFVSRKFDFIAALTLWRLETHKLVLWQTVKTQIKFHQDGHCLLRQNRSSDKEMKYFF